MEISKVNLVYFSATYTTKKIAKSIAEQINGTITEYDVTQTALQTDVMSERGDVLVLAAPVYSGRIPAQALEAFNRFKGHNALAVILCVYGNRDYDDALLELKNTVEENGFRVVSAGAFIAQHSIFPEVGSNRPDAADLSAACEFGAKSAGMITSLADVDLLPRIKVKGNRPYKTPGAIPIRPKGDRKCNECGICVKLCPVCAISEKAPRKTDKEKCISCGRCIVVCPSHARHFGGLLYKLAGNRFVNANSLRKEPELIYANLFTNEN